MKRITINTILILLSSVLIAGILTGCSQSKIEFQEGQHIENATYPETFKTYSYIDPLFELHIQDELFDDESSRELFDIILSDAETLSATFGTGGAPSIYLVQETPTEEIIAADGAIYCTPDDVTGGAYRYEFVKAYLGLTEPWKITGAYELVFGNEVDKESLTIFYSDENNLTTLSLFAAYFIDDLSFTVSQNIIKDTAAAFTEFLISEYDVDTFLGCTSQDGYRQAWLDSLGLSVDYQPIYDLRFLDEAVYSSNEKYGLIITTPVRVYAFAENFTETAEDMMYLLAFYHEGMEIVMDYISENAPEHAPQIESAWQDLQTISFESDIYGSYINQSGRSLHIGSASLRSFFNTTFHYLIPAEDREMEIWKTFGIADYLFAMTEQPDVAFYDYFLSEPDDSWEDDAVYLGLVQDYYLSHKDYPSNLKDFDFGRFYEGMAFITMNYPDLELFSTNFAKYSIARFSGSEAKYKPYSGNTLTYPEAYLFTKYLVDTYGLDNVLSYCMTYATLAFKNNFGVSYNEAYSDFRADYTIPD